MENYEATVDESLYSRQLYVLGNAAMKDLSESSILLSGLGGLGIEIAKNLILMGVKHLSIYDTTATTEADLGQNVFVNLEDVAYKRNRAEASRQLLQELNPYVFIEVLSDSLSSFEDFIINQLYHYQCVVLTDVLDLDFSIKINLVCRSHNPPIRFISASVIGIACYVFCDFGNDFVVTDPDGEEPKEIQIGSIIKGNPCIVNTSDDVRHGFSTGDTVFFKDILGVESINGKSFVISVVTPSSFSIGDGSHLEGIYTRGGFCKLLKEPVTINFESLENQLKHPKYETLDYSKSLASHTIHMAILALHHYAREYGELPNIRNIDNAKIFFQLVEEVKAHLSFSAYNLDYSLLQQISFTARGYLTPLSSFLGGLVSQEVVKSVTHKFTPLKQWLFLDGREVTEFQDDLPLNLFTNRGDRYDALRVCIGQNMLTCLANTKLFMVGCGAIGCEMLKTYSLLGISTCNGQITVSDHDLIEKSNLCRQFLFRMHHIGQPKSTVAAKAAHFINKDVKIKADQNKVWRKTEKIYSDEFFKEQDIIVNALDNLESRRYMDRRCIQTSRPLLESGTMGCKGHVQVILPHMTETYTSQSDPQEEEYPYCTIKSFPSRLEHTVQWAREKFENLFYSKPLAMQKLQQCQNSLDELIHKLEEGFVLSNASMLSKFLETRPRSYSDCIVLARMKFQKYFNFKAQQLLHIFPMDTLMKDGTPFWQSPKHPPNSINFNLDDRLHLLFISSTARILAAIWKIPVSSKELEFEFLAQTIERIHIPDFVPNATKVIEIDESAQKPDGKTSKAHDAHHLIHFLKKETSFPSVPVFPQAFEKDNDSNSHVDFIYAAAGLRSVMYGLEPGTKLEVKRIAGSIIPAIASTTAAIAGLVSLELLKIVKGLKDRQNYRNSFLNIALPTLILSEPAPPQVNFLRPDVSFTVWDHWHLDGKPEMLLQNFLEQLKDKTQMNPSMVLEGSKIIWMPILPGHVKRKTQTMLNLLKPEEMQEYCDLNVTYEGQMEDIMGPPVRYYFNKS